MVALLSTLVSTLGEPEEANDWLGQLSGGDSDDSPDSEEDGNEESDEEGLWGDMDQQLDESLKGGKQLDRVQLDLDVVENLLKSYDAQEGLPGPVSNMLRSMGIHLPDNDSIDELRGDSSAQ